MVRLTAFIAFLLLASGARAQTPRTLAVQGLLANAAGAPRPDGTYSVTFTLYDAATNTPAGWSQTASVTTRRGVFSAVLGAFPAALTFQKPYMLGIRVAGEAAEMTPRLPLTSAPYALRAGLVLPFTDSASSAGDLLSLTNTGTGAAFRGVNADTGNEATMGGPTTAVMGVDKAPGGPFTLSYGVLGQSTNGYGVWGGNTTSQAYGILGTPSAGVYAYNNDSSAAALRADAPNGTAVWGESAFGRGVFGLFTGSASTADFSAGVSGESRNSSAPGGLFRHTTGYALVATSAADGAKAAILAQAMGNNGNGLVGEANVGTGAYGVWGRSTSGYAGYFSGKVTVTGNLSVGGTLTKAAGSFKIDHPLDPEHKTLSHSFVESPDMMNIYNGNATLDPRGEAVVELPDWFEALNRDIRYQLTPIGAPGPNLYIASRVANNRFRIAGGTPNGEVSWQVTGIRQDAYANAHRIPVEEDKPAAGKGQP